LNLTVNARDAITEEGKVTIEGSQLTLEASECEGRPGLRPGRYVRVTLADTGAGMDASTALHAIEPFFTTKPRGKGTGLGLSTAFGIMQKSGGWLELRSAPGAGTAVTLLLPCVDGAELS
jgi:two-component system, cell cycle sensor histidine kinase and response regulator CckA